MRKNLRRWFRIFKYWWIGSPIPMSKWADKLTVVWSFSVQNLDQTDEDKLLCRTRKKAGFLIHRTGTFCIQTYHDLKWYRYFVKLCRREGLRAPRLTAFQPAKATKTP